jgi:uncharacterized protein (DUF1501 family)
MNRRDVLAVGAGLAPLIIAGRAFAAPQTQTRLLVVFLRGAYDAASLLVRSRASSTTPRVRPSPSRAPPRAIRTPPSR